MSGATTTTTTTTITRHQKQSRKRSLLCVMTTAAVMAAAAGRMTTTVSAFQHSSRTAAARSVGGRGGFGPRIGSFAERQFRAGPAAFLSERAGRSLQTPLFAADHDSTSTTRPLSTAAERGDSNGAASPSPAPSKPKQQASFVNDTMLVGKAISTSDLAAASIAEFESSAASVLALDATTLEIVPIASSISHENGEPTATAATSAQQPDSNNCTESLQYCVVDGDGKVVPASEETRMASAAEPEQRSGGESEGNKVSDESTHDLLTGPNFVKMFRNSAPYIANHRGTLAVYHIPGELLDWDGFSDLMDDIALTWLLGMKIVLVCGCRHQIDRRMEEASKDDPDGYDPVRRSSIRVTEPETLRVVKEEAGYVRFEVERQMARALRSHGGFNGGNGEQGDGNVVSGNFYSAQPFGVIDGVDYMYTGFPRRVEVDKIRGVHASNDIVLLTPLGVSPSGEIFNVNSESLAANVAGTMGASKVIYFAVRGTALVKRESNKIVQNLRLSDAKNLLQHYRVKIHKRGFASVDDRGIEDSGSPSAALNLPEAVRRARTSPAVTESLLKIGWATSALERGVKRAHIIAPTNGALLQELYTRDGSGTLISRDLYEGIRPADVNDVAGIYDLIDPLVKTGTLVPRPLSVMEKDIKSYYVYTRDNLIVATVQLKRFEDGFAEIGCLVVSRDYRSQGRGDAMLGYLERICLQCGATKVFVLSTQTMEWFVERGFREVGVDALPPSRRAVYNYSRGSKIFMKKIDGDRDLDAAELWWNR